MAWIINGNPELERMSRWRLVLAVCLTCSVCMTAIVALRTYVRVKIVKALGVDDYLVYLASVASIAYGAFCISQTRLGLALPTPIRPKANLAEYSIQNFAARPLYNVASTGFKMALCFSYLRIIQNSGSTKYRIAIWSVMGMLLGFGIGYTVAILFACSPIQKSWKPAVPGKCLPIADFYYGTGIVTIITDLILFFLPIPLLWRLQMGTQRKAGLTITFLLGTFTTVCSIMRVQATTYVLKSMDSTNYILWGVIECHVGIITTSIPALTPLLKNIRKATYLSGRRQDYSYQKGASRQQGVRSMGISAPSAIDHRSKTGTEAWSGSQSSQEHILINGKEAMEMGDITKTMDVRVTRAPRTASTEPSMYLEKGLPV